MKTWDDFVDRVKSQTNSEIAGSPEIALGLASSKGDGGRALIGLGGPEDY